MVMVQLPATGDETNDNPSFRLMYAIMTKLEAVRCVMAYVDERQAQGVEPWGDYELGAQAALSEVMALLLELETSSL